MAINMDSILAKAKQCMNTQQKKKDVLYVVDSIITGSKKFSFKTGTSFVAHTPEEAAHKFIRVLQMEILSSAGTNHGAGQLGYSATASLTDLSFSNLTNIAPGVYTIDVNFDDDLTRSSMSKKGESVRNIAALLNNGYSAGKQVWGMWHEHKQASLMMRDGAHFIDNAISQFMSTYASEYGVIDIQVHDDYK